MGGVGFLRFLLFFDLVCIWVDEAGGDPMSELRLLLDLVSLVGGGCDSLGLLGATLGARVLESGVLPLIFFFSDGAV